VAIAILTPEYLCRIASTLNAHERQLEMLCVAQTEDVFFLVGSPAKTIELKVAIISTENGLRYPIINVHFCFP
jgi:hypothetical protein